MSFKRKLIKCCLDVILVITAIIGAIGITSFVCKFIITDIWTKIQLFA